MLYYFHGYLHVDGCFLTSQYSFFLREALWVIFFLVLFSNFVFFLLFVFFVSVYLMFLIEV